MKPLTYLFGRRRQWGPITGFAATLVPAVILTACGAAPAADEASILTIAYPGDERLLSPYWDMPAKFLVFEPLMEVDSAGEIRGALARRWEHSSDYRATTFHLRTDVRWHDGVPFTAHDVKFTLDLAGHPDALMFSTGVDSVQVHDDSTATVHYKPGANPFDAWTVYYPKHLLEGLDPASWAEWDFWKTPVGTGPYRVRRHLPRTLIELEANPDYFRGEPSVGTIRLRLGPNALTELLAGNVDILTEVQHGEVPKLRGDPRFRIYERYNPSAYQMLLLNADAGPFADMRVRRALTVAVDRRELARLLDYPEDVPLTNAVFTSRLFLRGELAPALPHDAEGARRMLAEAGWRDRDGDGVVDRHGRPLRFTALASAQWERHAILIKEQLERVGVRMEIDMREAVRPPMLERDDWEAAFMIVPQNPRVLRFITERGDASPALTALIDSAAASVHPDERDRLYRRIAPLLTELSPHVHLLPLLERSVMHRRVRGMQTPFRADPVWYAADLWLEERD